MKKSWQPLAIVAALAIIAGFGGGFFLARLTESRALSGARSTVTRQVDAIQRNDFPEAYKLASYRVRQRLGERTFEAVLRLECQSLIQGAKLELGDIAWTKEGNLYVQGLFQHPDGMVSPALFLLMPEEGSWRVHSLEIGAAGRPVAGRESALEV